MKLLSVSFFSFMLLNSQLWSEAVLTEDNLAYRTLFHDLERLFRFDTVKVYICDGSETVIRNAIEIYVLREEKGDIPAKFFNIAESFSKVTHVEYDPKSQTVTIVGEREEARKDASGNVITDPKTDEPVFETIGYTNRYRISPPDQQGLELHPIKVERHSKKKEKP